MYRLSLPLALAFVPMLTTSKPAYSRGPTINVTHRFTGLSCAGLCVDETMTVFFDSRVIWKFSDPSKKAARTYSAKLNVGSKFAGAYIRKMQRLKPSVISKSRTGCGAEADRRGVWDWEISWPSDTPALQYFTYDADRAVSANWRSALVALGMRDGLIDRSRWKANVRLVSEVR